MSRLSSRRNLAVFVLAMILATPWASGFELPGRPRAGAEQSDSLALPGLLGRLGSFLSSLWSKNGGGADPNGQPLGQPAGGGSTTTTDAGGSADPNGLPGH